MSEYIRKHEKNVLRDFRSSRPEVFYKKGVLRKFANFTEKHLCQSLFLIKLKSACNFIKNVALAQMFSCEFTKFLRTSFLIEHIRWLFLELFLKDCSTFAYRLYNILKWTLLCRRTFTTPNFSAYHFRLGLWKPKLKPKMLISLTCVVRKDQLFQSFLFSNLYLKKNLLEKKF